MLKKSLLLFVFLFAITANCQYYNLSNKAKVSVLTCGSGSELYAIYGHTGLRFQDVTNNLDVVYNYGNFDFATNNFYLKFVKGDLQYFVAACSFQDFMQEYIITNRAVYEQKILLDDYQKQQLFDEINTSLFSEERNYTYKFIDKNCTTMVLDKINDVYGSKIITKKNNLEPSYRTILYGFLDNHFWENFGINIIFGTKVDNNATKLFLPKELMQNIATSKFRGHKISEKIEILNKKVILKSEFSFWNSIYPYCLFLLIIIIFNKKFLNYTYFIVLGLIGIFFSTVGLYSFHQEIYYNYNILLFNPTLLILVYFMINNNRRWILNLTYFNLLCLSIYVLVLLNKPHLLMILPMVFCSTIIIIRITFKNKLLSSIK